MKQVSLKFLILTPPPVLNVLFLLFGYKPASEFYVQTFRDTANSIFIGGASGGAGLLARSQSSEGPATGHLNKGFSWFPCVYKQMLRRFPRFQLSLHASHVALPTEI
jgi:hypothetical protein